MAKLTANEIQLFNALHNSRAEDYKTFKKKSYRGVWSSIVDKYPESAHFIYELLQNADDADATEVSIILKKDRLLFKHNGTKHFDITREDDSKVGDINSITGIGDSSKNDETQNKIGKFGVGFKAVFQYSDTPEIYDDTFKFKIENYIVPTLLDHDNPKRKKGETLFVFPFKNKEKSYQDILKRLRSLKNPILFLRNIKRITWSVDRENFDGYEVEYSKELLDSTDFDDDNITFEHYRLHDSCNDKEIFLFSEKVQITEANGKISFHLINVGFFYDPKIKRLITDRTQNIYCFFPTNETFGTCFISHAPFLLTDNRQNLKPGENLNKDLIHLLSKLAAKAVLFLRDYQVEENVLLIDENITQIIPNYKSWDMNDVFEEPMKDAFDDLLSSERILLSRNGKYLSMKEALIGTPRELVDLLSQKQIYQLRKGYYELEDEDDSFEVHNVDFLKWELAQKINKLDNDMYSEIETYTSEDFANDINADFMSKQDLKWVTKMYTFLRTAAPKLWKITDKKHSHSTSGLPFRTAPIIRTEEGEWVPPFLKDGSPNVFLPIKKDKDSGYNFVANEYVNNEMSMKFFSELDIKKPDEIDYIRQVILGKFDVEDFEINDEDLQSDFLVLVKYFLRVRDSKLENDFIQLTINHLYLCGKDDALHRPNELYLYNENLKTYFQDDDDSRYLNLDFYRSATVKYGDAVVEKFVLSLGVHKYPKVLSVPRYSFFFLREGIKNLIPGSDYQEYSIEDRELEGFEKFSESDPLDIDTSLYLWNEVLPNIGFSKYENLTVKYRRKYARTFEEAYFISTFKYALQHDQWLVDKNDNAVSAEEVALEDLNPGYDRNNGLIQFLGIEKKEKSIVELGGTQEQQNQMDLGKRIKSLAGDDLTEEEIIQAIAAAKAKKVEKKNSDRWHHEVPSNEEDNNTNLSKNGFGESYVPHDDKATSDGKEEIAYQEGNIKENIIKTEEPVDEFSRTELRNLNPAEAFVSSDRPIPLTTVTDEITEEEKVDDVLQKLAEEEESHNKTIELRNIAKSSPRYSKEWFDALIELEYKGGAETEKTASGKAINISFNSVCKEKGSERIYVFKNPSRNIPLWMEELDDIEVKCTFADRDDMSLKFEVANVRDNSLLLKASKVYEKILNKIEWYRCTRASITLKNQIDLMGKLRTAFNSLNLPADFNLKDNLQDDLQFIFGPPGTGKTTTVAKKIISEMEANDVCKILVLAPTNTACDELTRKILEQSDGECVWLYRFIATADESLESYVIDRDSMVYDDDKCCLVSTMARLSFDGFNGIGGNNRLTDIGWDMIVCDEASMIPLAEMALTIYTFPGIPIVIAGDPMQIKPIVHEEEWKDENIYSMVELNRFDHPVTHPIQFKIDNLDTQYRSVPAIGELFNQYAYDGKLLHFRSALPQDTQFGRLSLKPINFVSFKVEKYDSIFGIKKLDGSNVHIYSALLTIEMFKYIINQKEIEDIGDYSIGIVCPYAPQAQLIESLIAQIPNIPGNVKVTVGTVHRFQGGQCNLMFVVLNPPLGMKVAADRIFLNDKNILNVAISRAQDNLCILLPHRDTDGYSSLYEINSIGKIAMRRPKDVSFYTCDQIENIIFGRKFFIESNTFVTSHQLTNVYTRTSKRYEVRIDEKSVDVQLGSYQFIQPSSMVENLLPQDVKANVDSHSQTHEIVEKQAEEPSKEEASSEDQTISFAEIEQEVENSRNFETAEEYYDMFERLGIDMEKAMDILITSNTLCSMYVLIQIFGNESLPKRFGWRKPKESDIKAYKGDCRKYNLFKVTYPKLFDVIRGKHIWHMKKGEELNIKDITLETFKKFFTTHRHNKKNKKPKPIVRKKNNGSIYQQKEESNSGHLYDTFEYGLSDW
ncbi:MAG: sacsin N-terminal ATP-binding-like domain-containing protein [Prevotella sp.]|jgi:hypothetical protein